MASNGLLNRIDRALDIAQQYVNMYSYMITRQYPVVDDNDQPQTIGEYGYNKATEKGYGLRSRRDK